MLLPRVVFFGSGDFGVPVLHALHAAGAVALVVSQPDRPAGRGGVLTPTPVSEWALANGVPLLRPQDCNEPSVRDEIRRAAREAGLSDAARGAGAARGSPPAQPGPCFAVIAYGQKMGPQLLDGVFAINLHGSLLPRWRGAAPYQRAVMQGDRTAGVTVIEVAARMDAGGMFAKAELTIGPAMTAGELHDALRALGPDAMLGVLRAWRASGGMLRSEPQDEALATRAPKLSRADAWVDFASDADRVRARINGLSPWPGCAISVEGHPLKALRARAHEIAPAAAVQGAPGTLLPNRWVACGSGAVELVDVQPAGGRVMTFDAWCAGRRIGAGARVASEAP